MADVRQRLAVSFLTVVGVLAAGTLAYYLLGQGRWDLGDCAYQTLVVVTTVGLEVRLDGLEETPGNVFVTSALLILGLGTFLYFVSTLTAAILEGDLREDLRRRRMSKHIDRMSDHVIVCGVGTTGRHVVTELAVTGTRFVALDTNKERMEVVAAHVGVEFPYLIGDATDEDTLMLAGIERARGLISALPTDKDNLFVVVSAREANPLARIVARAVEQRADSLLRKAGAHATVSPNFMGGMQMAAEMLRPHVVEFMDVMLRNRDQNLRLEEVEVPEGSALAGKMLRDAPIRDDTDALVLAIRDRARQTYVHNPGPDMVLEGGTVLIVLVPVERLAKLRRIIETGSDTSS